MMIRFVLALAAALLAFPGAAHAQSQDWIYSQGEDEACFAMTFRGSFAFGIQAPAPGRTKATFVVMAPLDSVAAGGDPVTFTIGVPGPLAGPHVAATDDSPGLLTWFVDFEGFEQLDRFPDRFRFKAAKGSKSIIDSEMIGFRNALAQVQQCVAKR